MGSRSTDVEGEVDDDELVGPTSARRPTLLASSV
jgi:hypothetical protein